MKTSLLLYPHQLYAANYLPEVTTVYLIEDPIFFGADQDKPLRLHKQKIVHMRASMRRYAEEVLWPAGYDVEYIEFDPLMHVKDVLHKARKHDKTILFDPTNEALTTRLLEARRQLGDNAPALEFLASPNFYLKEHEVRQFFSEHHTHVFEEFYQWQRERFNILIEDYKPIGGSWLISSPKPSEGVTLPSFAVFGANKWVDEAKKFVSKHFANNFGSDDCVWPTSHNEAAQWLADFVENRIDEYAAYIDVFDKDAPWLYHSALSSSLNSGLLQPQQVVEAVMKRHARKPVPLASLERFVRQVIGHREFDRALTVMGGRKLKAVNTLKSTRRLTLAWYEGTTGIPMYDDLVAKLHTRGYAHHTERLHIAAALMVLCEIAPDDIHQWFTELFVDAQDWSVTPHVYALAQFADNSSLEGGPYLYTSKMLIDKSNYSRGEWVNVWDGLYWRFIERHKAILSKDPKMRSIVQRLSRIDADQKRIISYRAEDFLNKFTQ